MPVNIMAATSITRVQMYSGQPGTAATTLFTVAASTTAKVTQIVVCNTTGTAATLTLSLVPPAGAAGAANRILLAYPILANDIVIIDLAQYLDPTGFISALQGTASALTVTVSGEVYQ